MLNFNSRLVFLEAWPGWRALYYYGACFGFLGLMFWRPRWSSSIGALESLLTL